MPRNNSARRAARPAHASELFTDRVPESVAYTAALAAHRVYMDATEDLPTAKNLLVYYGVGGIGKTTLSERLEKWSNGELPTTDPWGPPPTAIAATCRIDLHRTQGHIDMVAALVSLRRAFGKVKKRWPAFDLAFATYWSAIRPGEPLPGAGTNDSIVADGVADSISEIASEIGVPGAGIATRTIRMVVKEVRSRMTHRRLFDQYEGFEELLGRCSELPTPDDPHPEVIGDIASLLDTDLCTWDKPQAPMIVAFVDTFERLIADPRRTDEAALNELIWRMPNVLFVVTGRNPIDWYDDARTNLFISGRTAWPGLIPGATAEPRQHLVGKLALEDRLRIIHRGRELYAIDVTDAVALELARASDGLPQYLDLALDLALNRKATGGAPIGVDDVTGSLNALVLRVLEDVPADEQRALRAASMFPFFDSFVVAEAAQVDDGCVQRALARPMIDRRGSRIYPYSMHDAIRLAIRSSDHSVPNGWSDTDWRKAGELGLAAVRQRYEASAAAKDTEATLDALALAIALVSDQCLTVEPAPSEKYDDWLSQAIVYGPSIAALRTTLPVRVTTQMGRGIVDFVISKSTEVTVDEAAERLTGVFESTHPLRLPAGRHRGYVLRNAGLWDEAIAAFNDLVAVAPTPLHCYQRVLTIATARRFAEAIDESGELPEVRAEAIRFYCAVGHGKFDGYLEEQRRVLATLWEVKRQREALEKQAEIYRWQAFLHGRISSADLDALREKAETAKHSIALRDEYLARLFRDPATLISNTDERAWIEGLDRARNFGDIGFRTGHIRLAVALYCDDDAGLAELADAIRSRQRPRSRMWIPIECVLDSYGYTVEIPPTQWLAPYTVVRDRWRGHFDAWLTRTRGGRVPE